jgi:hypothetical protein
MVAFIYSLNVAGLPVRVTWWDVVVGQAFQARN